VKLLDQSRFPFLTASSLKEEVSWNRSSLFKNSLQSLQECMSEKISRVPLTNEKRGRAGNTVQKLIKDTNQPKENNDTD
jgi:hypothetical protein